jgi:hypothetical protein
MSNNNPKALPVWSRLSDQEKVDTLTKLLDDIGSDSTKWNDCLYPVNARKYLEQYVVLDTVDFVEFLPDASASDRRIVLQRPPAPVTGTTPHYPADKGYWRCTYITYQ